MNAKRGMVLNLLTLATVLSMVVALAGDTTPVGQVGKVVNMRSDLPAYAVPFAPNDTNAIHFKVNIEYKSIPASLVIHWNTFKYKKSTFILSYWVSVQKAYPNIELSQPATFGNSLNMGTEKSIIQGIHILMNWEEHKLFAKRGGTMSFRIQSNGKYKFN
jgi:hypothetical protein